MILFFYFAGFGLQKDSELLPLFNHFILKGSENGVFSRISRAIKQDREENFEMMEPLPLGLNNVMFCFISLGFGISLSLILVMMEFIRKKALKDETLAINNAQGGRAIRVMAWNRNKNVVKQDPRLPHYHNYYEQRSAL